MNQTLVMKAVSQTRSLLDASMVDLLLQVMHVATHGLKSSEAMLLIQLKVLVPISTQITLIRTPEHVTKEVTLLPTRIKRMAWLRTTELSK
jgi:hypothetical protein